MAKQFKTTLGDTVPSQLIEVTYELDVAALLVDLYDLDDATDAIVLRR